MSPKLFSNFRQLYVLENSSLLWRKEIRHARISVRVFQKQFYSVEKCFSSKPFCGPFFEVLMLVKFLVRVLSIFTESVWRQITYLPKTRPSGFGERDLKREMSNVKKEKWKNWNSVCVFFGMWCMSCCAIYFFNSSHLFVCISFCLYVAGQHLFSISSDW